jgi:hypothetical protein
MVLKYVRVNAPTVVLQHVRVIDGTGRSPVEDQNLIIEQGKITSERVQKLRLATERRSSTCADIR